MFSDVFYFAATTADVIFVQS